MTPALYARAKDLFLEVCDLPEGDRRGRLEELCAGQPELLAAVRQLLQGDAKPLSLGRAAASAQQELDAALGAPGEELPQVPGYRVLERLGEGGMGSVFRAEQLEPVRRPVALKLMRSTLQGALARARFQAERQALARLAHPNVAAMYEAGATATGFPYFVMELVEGRPLIEDVDRRRLTVEERLALLVQVCRGVEHAHRKGILHRDLKPGNVLVTEVEGQPVPKIIDFGIARVLEAPGSEAATQTLGGFVGTPGYMSPEALEGSGDLDTRTDVYALGILLHELLAGVRPHRADTGSLTELILEVTQVDPPSLVERYRALPSGRKEEIARARDTDPAALERRLSGDLTWIVRKATSRDREERYGSAAELADELSRTLEDLPVRAAPPSLYDRAWKLARRHRAAVVATAIVVLAVVGGVVGLTSGLVRAQRERRNAEEVTKVLTRLITSTSPWNRSNELTIRQLLNDAARMVPARLGDQPAVQAGLLSEIGEALLHAGNAEDGERVLRHALAACRAVSGPDSIEAAGVMRSLGVALNYRTGAAQRPQRLAEAEELLRGCVAIREARRGRDSTSGCLLDLGDVLLSAGRGSEAEAAYRESLEIRQRLFAHGSRGSDASVVVISALNYGALMTARGCLDEAEHHLAPAVALAREAYGTKNYVYAKSLIRLGELRLEQRRFEEAERIEAEALDILDTLLSASDDRRAPCLTFLGTALRSLGRLEEAERFLAGSIAILEGWGGVQHQTLRRPLTELALVRSSQGRSGDAAALIERALLLPEESDYQERIDIARAQEARAVVKAATASRTARP